MAAATKTHRSFGEWWSAHFELVALLGLLALIIMAAIFGTAVGNHAGA